MDDNLTDLEQQILDFEARWAQSAHGRGAKVSAIWRELQLSDVRYAQLLNGLLDRPAAALYDPSTINRLRRVREQQMRLRRAG